MISSRRLQTKPRETWRRRPHMGNWHRGPFSGDWVLPDEILRRGHGSGAHATRFPRPWRDPQPAIYFDARVIPSWPACSIFGRLETGRAVARPPPAQLLAFVASKSLFAIRVPRKTRKLCPQTWSCARFANYFLVTSIAGAGHVNSEAEPRSGAIHGEPPTLAQTEPSTVNSFAMMLW